MGNRKTKTDNNGTHNYTYDTLNRLVEAVNPLPSNPLESFTYDPVGNRVNSNQNGASTFNIANQLLEDADFTYQYDNNGNLTLKTPKIPGPFTSYEYDAENKLVRVVTNGTTANYKYDGLGRRVEKEVTNVGTTVTRYIYDNEDILLELDGSNNITARYTHGPGIDEPLVLEKAGASFFYHADGLGSITEITDSSGVLKQQYAYSSFGKIESQLDANFIQPYTFTSREFDPETGLYHYRRRTYNPHTGTFPQEDPIGFAGGNINLYSYVRNNPVGHRDPFGLQATDSGTCGVPNPNAPTNPEPQKPQPQSCFNNNPRGSYGILLGFTAAAAAEAIHVGELLIHGGLVAAATGGPVGIAVGIPVAVLGVGIAAGGVVLGLEAVGVLDLGILPKPCPQ